MTTSALAWHLGLLCRGRGVGVPPNRPNLPVDSEGTLPHCHGWIGLKERIAHCAPGMAVEHPEVLTCKTGRAKRNEQIS